jgi:hypothetical protein
VINRKVNKSGIMENKLRSTMEIEWEYEGVCEGNSGIHWNKKQDKSSDKHWVAYGWLQKKMLDVED